MCNCSIYITNIYCITRMSTTVHANTPTDVRRATAHAPPSQLLVAHIVVSAFSKKLSTSCAEWVDFNLAKCIRPRPSVLLRGHFLSSNLGTEYSVCDVRTLGAVCVCVCVDCAAGWRRHRVRTDRQLSKQQINVVN